MALLKIQEGAATETAAEIKNIVQSIEKTMEDLDGIFKKTAAGMELAWADDLRNDWTRYFNNDIPATMADMLKSAENLNKAVDAAIAYSKQ